MSPAEALAIQAMGRQAIQAIQSMLEVISVTAHDQGSGQASHRTVKLPDEIDPLIATEDEEDLLHKAMEAAQAEKDAFVAAVWAEKTSEAKVEDE